MTTARAGGRRRRTLGLARRMHVSGFDVVSGAGFWGFGVLGWGLRAPAGGWRLGWMRKESSGLK